MIKHTLLILIAVFFLIFGVLHLQHAETMARIMPGFIPFKVEIVWWTGILEIVFAAGLVWPRFRALTGLWLSVYLLAVLPANINMAIYEMPFGDEQPSALVLWVRVFLQFPFIALILWASGGWASWKQHRWRAFLPGHRPQERP